MYQIVEQFETLEQLMKYEQDQKDVQQMRASVQALYDIIRIEVRRKLQTVSKHRLHVFVRGDEVVHPQWAGYIVAELVGFGYLDYVSKPTTITTSAGRKLGCVGIVNGMIRKFTIPPYSWAECDNMVHAMKDWHRHFGIIGRIKDHTEIYRMRR